MTRKNSESRLKAEIQRLEAENAFLRAHVQLATSEHSTHANDSNGYFSYLWQLTKNNSLYKLIKRLTNYFSKFRLISLLLRLFRYIAIAIETSAVIFIFITVLAFLLPPIVFGSLIVFICSVSRFYHDIKQINENAAEKKVIIYFLGRQQPYMKDSFFGRNALELSQNGYCVIVISPFIMSPKGFFDTKKYYFNVRKEADGVFTVRQHYFFYLRKNFLNSHQKRLIYVY